LQHATCRAMKEIQQTPHRNNLPIVHAFRPGASSFQQFTEHYCVAVEWDTPPLLTLTQSDLFRGSPLFLKAEWALPRRLCKV